MANFFKSKLVENLLDGDLPTVKTEVTVEKRSLVNIALTIMGIAVGITALIVILRMTK